MSAQVFESYEGTFYLRKKGTGKSVAFQVGVEVDPDGTTDGVLLDLDGNVLRRFAGAVGDHALVSTAIRQFAKVLPLVVVAVL